MFRYKGKRRDSLGHSLDTKYNWENQDLYWQAKNL